MAVQNPVETEDKAVEGKDQEKGNLLDNDTLRKLHSGEVDFDDLKTEQKVEFHSRFVEGDETEVPTEEEEAEILAKAGNPEEVQNGEPASAPEVKPEELAPDEQARRQAYKTLRDNNNTLTQKLATMAEKMGTLKESKIDAPPALEQSEFDENAKLQHKYNTELSEKLNKKVDDEVAAINVERAELQQLSMYSHVSMLQSENMELKTEKPIVALDKAFVNFRNQLAPGTDEAAKNKAVDDFLSNADNRKSKESEGIMFPFSEKDWKSYQTISTINAYKRNGGDPNWDSAVKGDKYPDLDVAYYAYKKETDYIPDPIKQAAIDATTKIVDQVSNNQQQATILSSEDGYSGSNEAGMTEAQAEQWLIDHHTPSTPEDKRVLAEIMAKFSQNGPPAPTISM